MALSVAALVLATVPAGGGQAMAGQLTPGHRPAGIQAGAKKSLGFTVNSAVGTAQGPALTDPMPGTGGNYARLHTLGMVGVSTQSGRTLWQRSADSLYADWHVTFPTLRTTVDPAPEVPTVTDPLAPTVPQLLYSADTEGAANVHPVATGYLTGSRVPVVAVAETVGVMLGSSTVSPFHVPGSALHYGSFVTVLNGRTGQTMYYQLDPGYVTQLAITGGRLVMDDETGYPLSPLIPIGAWRSVTTVRALSFRPDGGGLAASTAWSFTTHAPWAAVLGLQPVGHDLAFTWSDTPEDLGVPGPPDGHVVMIDPDGRVLWNVGTSGYPVLAGYDSYHRLLVVAEQDDPTMRIGYTLTGLRPSNGSVAVSVPIAGVLPTTMVVSAGTWYTAGIVTTMQQIGNGVFTGGRVSAVDPARRRVLWSAALTGSSSNEPFPETILASGTWWPGQAVVVGSSLGLQLPTVAQPTSTTSLVQVFSGATGQMLWHRSGAVADPRSLALTGVPWIPQLIGITDNQDAVSYNLRSGAVQAMTPLMGDITTAVPAQIDGHRVVIAGSQSGGVFALDASDLSRVLWQSYAGAAVHQITLAATAPCGPPALVVAATNRVDVMDPDTGRIRVSRGFPGQFVWNATVGTIGHDWSAIVVGTDRLTAFDACTGRLLWTYRAPVPAYFSNPVIVDGTTVAEYQNQVKNAQPPTTMAAVGVGPAGRASWTAPAPTATTSRAVLDNGVFASPDIAGAGTTGVALAWQNGGSGRADVRDALTGALVYSDSNSNLQGLQGWAIDPQYGLVAITAGGSVLLEPGHSVATQIRGSSATFATVAGHTDLIVGATALLQAFPATDLRPGGGSTPRGYDTTYTSGTVVPVGGPSSGQVISMPQDEVVLAVVQGAELGLPGGLSVAAPLVNGLTVETLTGTVSAGTVSASTGPATTGPAKPAARPTVVSVPAPRLGVGLATPRLEIKVRGYSRAGRPVLSAATPAGYDPATIGKYLHLTGDGAGQTVAVVDAYADPDITADVNTFSGQYGLPKVCGTTGAGAGCFHFTVSAPQGQPGSNADWALETSLDVEWIHAIAPKASVVLVEARNDTFSQLFAAVASAGALHPDAVSMSWGSNGEFSGETYYDGACALTRSVCVAAAGDYGYPGGYPAYNPHVIAVGGTTLNLTSDGTVSSETDWNGSGGGQSFFEAKPAAQQGVTPGNYRGIPDVSFDADPDTGVAVYDSVPYEGYKGWFEVGGTSVGAPSWSAILASADQLRAAAGKPRLVAAGDGAADAIYSLTTGLARITSGPPNGLCPDCQPGPGYDFITGLGSPRTGIDQALATAP